MARQKRDLDKIVADLTMIEDLETKHRIAKKILSVGYKQGIFPASINEFYLARGRAEVGGFTVPAINLRSLTYDLARAIFRVAKRNNSASFIFEIAKSEIGYTDQPPVEYAAVCIAAAIKEGWQGPVFIQGDHFQVNAKKYKEDPQKEIDGLKSLICEAINAGFYNIDIDSSTLVDLSRRTKLQQQELNYRVCAELTTFIRKNQPRGIQISVGGEIGEVGGQNSTPEELRAYMKGYRRALRKNYQGISKISVQTGTSHGGVVLPDGSIAKVSIDFDTLKNLSEVAKSEFGMSGAVQHGASTLPDEAFHKFPEVDTAEIHLATGFQNMIYESPHFPSDLRDQIYTWIKENLSCERKEGQTDEQFIYKTRKKAFGPFKRQIAGLSEEIRNAIASQIEQKFEFLFKQLRSIDTKESVDKYTILKKVVSRRKRQEGPLQRDTEGDD
jgi:fructose/tagatose bisphosphate aldolase